MSASPRQMHVERTDDPAVLRWVCHDEALAAAVSGPRAVPDGSPLGRLVAEGSIIDVGVRRGDILIRAANADSWAGIAPRVRDALAVELDAKDESAEHWLVVGLGTPVLPSVADVQHLVDRAAGGMTALHGGSMTVVAVEPGVVRLRAQGACDGCPQSDNTTLAIIAPMLRAEYPDLVDVVVEPSAAAASPKIDWARFGRR